MNIGDVKGSKAYGDLDGNVKQTLQQVEKMFQREKSIIEANRKHLAEPLPKLSRSMKAVEGKLDNWMDHLERQYEQMQKFRASVNTELRNAETAYFLLRRLISHTYEPTTEEQALPSEYFWQVSNGFEERMQECRQRIDELEQYLSSSSNPRAYSPKMIQDIVDNQHEFFITITASVAAIHEMVDVLREDYITLRKRFDRNYRGNPFEEAQRWREDKSLGKLADSKLKKKQHTQGQGSAWAAGFGNTKPAATGVGGSAWGATTGAGGGFSYDTAGGGGGTGGATGSNFSFGSGTGTGGGGGGSGGTGAGGFNFGTGGTGGGGGGSEASSPL